LRLVREGEAGSEEALALGLARKEKWAAAAAWKQYAPLVFGVLSRALGGPGGAEELTQRVLLRTFDASRSLKQGATVSSLIYAACARVLVPELRRRRIFGRFRTPAAEEPWPVARPARKVLARYYAALDRLASVERVLFAFSTFEQLSERELAQALGLAPDKVRKRLRHAQRTVNDSVALDPLIVAFVAEERPRSDLREGA
jgi:RNA polymerase sigma factor (sigma-70 family)